MVATAIEIDTTARMLYAAEMSAGFIETISHLEILPVLSGLAHSAYVSDEISVIPIHSFLVDRNKIFVRSVGLKCSLLETLEGII